MNQDVFSLNYILNSVVVFFILKIPIVVTNGDLGVTQQPCFLGCGQFSKGKGRCYHIVLVGACTCAMLKCGYFQSKPTKYCLSH